MITGIRAWMATPILLLLAALSACNSKGPATNAAAGSGAGAPISAADHAEQSKLNAYTQCYNSLLGNGGLAEQFRIYQQSNIGHETASDNIAVSVGGIDFWRDRLKVARAMPAGSAELDAGADTLVAALDKVVARLSGLQVYYSSRAYRDDNLARGKLEDPLMLAEYKSALSALDSFGELLDHDIQRRETARIEALKSSGHLLAYDTQLSLMQARGVVKLFRRPADLSDAALLNQGDAQIVLLQHTLDDFREELSKVGTDPLRMGPEHQTVAKELTAVVGSYRDIKDKHRPQDFQSMVEHFNEAVRMGNSLHD